MRGRKWAAVTNGHKQKNRGCASRGRTALLQRKDSASERNIGQGLEFEAKRWTPNLKSRLPLSRGRGLVSRPVAGFSSEEGEAADFQRVPAGCQAGATHIASHLTLTFSLSDGPCYLHFTDKETEAQSYQPAEEAVGLEILPLGCLVLTARPYHPPSLSQTYRQDVAEVADDSFQPLVGCASHLRYVSCDHVPLSSSALNQLSQSHLIFKC